MGGYIVPPPVHRVIKEMEYMRYNTMFDVAFTVDHEFENPGCVPVPLLIIGLERRLAYLKANREEAVEAFGILDTIELDEPDD